MKKALALVLLSIFCICFCVSAAASQNEEQFEYSYENGVEIIFDSNTAFSAEQRQFIADYLSVYDSAETSADDLEPTRLSWCWLVGHDYKTDYVMRIVHKVRDTEPRCYAETYEVTTCTKCDYMETELTGSAFILCCPED